MKMGSAVVSIILAFLGGLVIGNLTSSKSAEETEAGLVQEGEGSNGAGAAAAAEPGAPERFNVPVGPNDPQKGPSDALITIVEFSDFECPFCSRVGPTLKQIMDDYRGKVRVVWRNAPLPFHNNATPASEAAIEAFKQGRSEKFWQMHDLLFANQQALGRPDLERYAQQIGLDMTRFRAALDGHTNKAKVDEDLAVAQRIGANGTPNFFINGRQLVGAQPVEAFKQVIDDELARAERLVKAGTPKARIYAELTRGGLTAAKPPEAPAARPSQPQRPAEDTTTVFKVPVGRSPVKGTADALVTMVVFSDFQCPFCSRVEATVSQLVTDYGRDLRIVWKNNPLPFHDNATPAAELAMEANAQGKFWQAHAKLFEHSAELGRPQLEQYAQELGLNVARVRAALDGHTHKAGIDEDMALARKLGATGTPCFFVNGRRLSGARPIANFKSLIDEELAKARAMVAAGTPRARVYETLMRDAAESPPPAPAAAAAPEEAGEDPNKVYNIPVPADAPRKGGRNARVTIQLFSDFECPFCSRVGPSLAQVEREYGDRVQIIWRNYPLPFHNSAMPAAQAAVEVYKQGGSAKFWAFHDLLFQNQRALGRPELEQYATQIGGINLARFRAALDNQTHKAAVEADMNAITTAGIGSFGTPSCFINGKLLSGAQPFEAFKAAIDAALAAR